MTSRGETRNSTRIMTVMSWGVWLIVISLSAGGACYAADPPTDAEWAAATLTLRMHYRVGGVNNTPMKRTPWLLVNADHDITHVKCSTGVLDHYHAKYDYGAPGKPTTAQGNAYWDWYYSGWNIPSAQTPLMESRIDRITNCTTQTNCMSAAFDGYKAGTIVKYWVQTSAATPLFSELYHWQGAKESNRCRSGDAHAWWLLEDSPVYSVGWKSNVSGEYEWHRLVKPSTCAPRMYPRAWSATHIYKRSQNE